MRSKQTHFGIVWPGQHDSIKFGLVAILVDAKNAAQKLQGTFGQSFRQLAPQNGRGGINDELQPLAILFGYHQFLVVQKVAVGQGE